MTLVGRPAAQEAQMKRRRRNPNDAEVHEAVLQRIREMTREDWLKSIAELSPAPEGVEDPWPPYDGPGSNGADPTSPQESPTAPEPER